VLEHNYPMPINSSKHDLVVFISVMHWLLFFTEVAPFINCVQDSVMVILAGLLTLLK
jgi:hypothetical protein